MKSGPHASDTGPGTGLLDASELGRLLRRFQESRVTLCSRTPLSESVTSLVREFVCSAAGREIALDVLVSPTMDAGAVLYVGDAGRVVLDPRAMWLSGIERAVREGFDSGRSLDAGDAYAHLRELLSASAPEPGIEELLDTGSVVRIGDGVAMVTGLRDVGSQEIVEFECGTLGLAFS